MNEIRVRSRARSLSAVWRVAENARTSNPRRLASPQPWAGGLAQVAGRACGPEASLPPGHAIGHANVHGNAHGDPVVAGAHAYGAAPDGKERPLFRMPRAPR